MYDDSTTIMGPDDVSADAIQRWIVARNPAAPDLGAAIHDTAVAAGLRPSFICAQVAEETGTWTSARALQSNNPAGLGSTDDGAWGATFATPLEGIRAEVAHWLTYIYGDANTWKALDPRYDAEMSTGNAGTIRTVGQIGGGIWATDPTYSGKIIALMNDLVPDTQAAPTPQPTPPQGGATLDIQDVRDQLPTNPSGGSGQTFAPKRGLIWHYTGPAVNMDADEMTMLISYANYHIGPYLREGGIAYHYDIAPDGTVRLLRNPDAVLWHCGSWPENQTHYGVHIELGEGQNATAAQITSAIALADHLRTQDSFGYDQCKGHQEVSSTACPGSLMQDLVYPYRTGGMTVSDRIQFAETGHGIDGAIRRHFEHNGGVVVFGYPISELMDDPDGAHNPDGTPMQVQYFEANVLEIHPENAAPNDVQRRRLGAKEAVAHGWSGPGVQYP